MNDNSTFGLHPLDYFVFGAGGPSAGGGWVVQRQDELTMWVPSLLEIECTCRVHLVPEGTRGIE